MNHARSSNNNSQNETVPSRFLPREPGGVPRREKALNSHREAAGSTSASLHPRDHATPTLPARPPAALGLSQRYVTVKNTPYQCCDGNMEGYFAGGVLPAGEMVLALPELGKGLGKHRKPTTGFVREVGLVNLDPHNLRKVEEL